MAKNRATPSGFMMNGFIPSSGAESGLKSGMSEPVHFFAAASQPITLRFASYGLPVRSQDARLYKMRRFAGQAYAQLSVCPRPNGSELSHRAIRLPFSDQLPAKIQQPHDVEPSSRNSAKPFSCSPAFTSTLVLSLGSVTSCKALPENSFASSSGEGEAGWRCFQFRFRIGSGKAPPSFLYISFSLKKMPAMISGSAFASAGGSVAFQCHCSTRLELTSEPSSSAKQVEGRRNTSVWILDGSTSLYSPWFCQNSEVSVVSGSMMTRYLSLAREPEIFTLHGAEASGLKP